MAPGGAGAPPTTKPSTATAVPPGPRWPLLPSATTRMVCVPGPRPWNRCATPNLVLVPDRSNTPLPRPSTRTWARPRPGPVAVSHRTAGPEKVSDAPAPGAVDVAYHPSVARRFHAVPHRHVVVRFDSSTDVAALNGSCV